LYSIQLTSVISSNMADPSLYTYPSPLEGYRGLDPLPKSVMAPFASAVRDVWLTNALVVRKLQMANHTSILRRRRKVKHTTLS
jgi:hypothetical protein